MRMDSPFFLGEMAKMGSMTPATHSCHAEVPGYRPDLVILPPSITSRLPFRLLFHPLILFGPKVSTSALKASNAS